MPTIVIDGQPVECRDGISVLQAALEAGWDVPHYCYHPGLKVVASCRLCLMEMKMPHPQTKELGWAPKLFPACHTPVRDGLEVRFDSDKVRSARQHAMEYYLINHPLDCPVCDKAGECYLQDYTERYGYATSRMVEDKYKNPKKNLGPRTLLYADRCVLCKRCVRFCDEIAGTGELRVANRGSRNEIDVFPGVPLENELQGNVVDLCPVGALLDKDFLFSQRVWFMRSVKSISPADSRGQAIYIDCNNQGVHRIRARYNPKVNDWWISDEARFGWKYINSDQRHRRPQVRRGQQWESVSWEELPALVRFRIEDTSDAEGGADVAAVLSPMMSCEEAWLLARTVREIAPRAALVLGHVPVEGEDKTFPGGFVIKAEKCPNRRGVETIMDHLGGARLGFDEFLAAAGEGRFKVVYLTGGYPTSDWVNKEAVKALGGLDELIVHDLLAGPLDAVATVRIPSASFAEREGSFMNCDGLVQPFERAVPPLEGVKADGQFLFELAGREGLFRAADVRAEMGREIPALGEVYEPPEMPRYAH